MRMISLLLLCWISGAAAQPGAPVLVLTQSGAIGPASADYLHRGIDHAARIGAQLIVLRMDTPGGLDLSMRDIIRDILASPVPVATYVAPSGARAASAGTYILYASHIAAMAPATNLGAATPVNLAGPGDTGARQPRHDKNAKDAPQAASGDQAMMHKQVNDSAAYIRGLAQLRGRNAQWAERAVREAVSLSAREALKLKVIDMIAADVPQLLQQLDGRSVAASGRDVILHTAAAPVVQRDPDWRTEFLALITNPAIAYLLLLIGVYGLVFEFMNPGFALPGVVGGICLLVGLFALQLLPVNYAGLALMALGIVLFVLEFLTAGTAVLGVGGVIAFVAGSIMLIDTDAVGFTIPLAMIGTVAALGAAGLLVLVRLAITARRRPVVSGREQLVGATGVVLDNAPDCYARIEGERWKVRSAAALRPGDRVRVTRIDGLVLDVDVIEAELDTKE